MGAAAYDRISLSVLLPFITLLLLFLSTISTSYVNEDLWLSFASGRNTIERGVAQPDNWSITEQGKVWINQAWLSHVLLFLAYDHLGPSGPVGIKIALLICCLISVYIGARRSGASRNCTALSCCLGLLTIAPFLGLRPENFGVFWFCIFLYTIRAKFTSILKTLVLTIVVVCWSNFHGSFMLGLTLLCLKSAIDLAFSFSIAGPFYNRNSWKEFLTDAPAFGLSVIAVTIFNPFGIENLLMPFKQLGTKAVTEHSADWLPVWNSNAAQHFIFGGGSTFWFNFFVFTLSVSTVLLLIFSVGNRRGLEEILSRQNNAIFDFVTCILLIIFACKFQRLILFAGFALVIPTAVIFQELQFFNGSCL